MIYGYVMATKPKEEETQINNILKEYPNAVIYKDAYSDNLEDRKAFNKLQCITRSSDTIVFNDISQLSSDKQLCVDLYKELYYEDVKLIFLKQLSINSFAYKQTSDEFVIHHVNPLVEKLTEHVDNFIENLMAKQIMQAYEQVKQKSLERSQSTKEGLKKAKRQGKQIGRPTGSKIVTKKSIEAKKLIRKYCKDFDGSLNDQDTVIQIKGKLGKFSKNTYYKYKQELKEENMQVLHQEIVIALNDNKYYQELLSMTGREIYEKYYLKRDECIGLSVKFPDGIDAHIRIVICGDEEKPYVECVLFDGGWEVYTSDCTDYVVGTWELKYKDTKYIITVRAE